MRWSVVFSLLLCAAVRAQQPAAEWKPLFDGRSLDGWTVADFYKHGKVSVENATIVLGLGEFFGAITGVNYARDFPKSNYEIRFEAARLEGSDFFAGLTFPVKDSFCTWINGGWGGSVVGLSSLDGLDASENETSQNREFLRGRWYRFWLRVTDEWIQAWIDDDYVIEVPLARHKIDLRFGEIELSKPLGFAAYSTVSALRNIEYRPVPPSAAPAPAR